MLQNVFAKTVRDRGVATLVVAAVLLFFCVFTIGIYSGFDDDALGFYQDMPEALQALYGESDGTAAGIVTGAIFSLLAPILLLVAAISGGSDAALGEERRGSIGLLLANPLSRRGVLLSKAAVMLLGTALLAAVVWVGVAASSALFGLDLQGLDVGAASVQLVGLAWMFGAFTLALGTATGRSSAAGVAAVVAAVSYLVTSLFPLEPRLEEYAKFTPWYLYSGNEPLRHGVDGVSLLVMVVATALLIGVGVSLYDRRDLAG